MATWKKVIVSGSNVSQLANDANYLVNAQSGATLTGSFTGSFAGDGSGLTNVPASGIVLAPLTNGNGITPFEYSGSVAQTVTLDTASAHFTAGVRGKISATDTTGASGINLDYNSANGTISGSLVNSTIGLGSTTINLGASASSVSNLTLVSATASGSFSGSFQGDGSGLTGVASSLNISGSTGNITIDLKTETLGILGTNNEITAVASGNDVTIGLPDDVTITQDLTVNRNLTVLGTASFQNTTNLDVADRFILMASGSNTAGDGGIVIQQGTQGIGEAFGYDNGATRWGVTGSFDGSQATFTPDAFMAAAVLGGVGVNDPSSVAARYVAKGNIFVGDNSDIYIYS